MALQTRRRRLTALNRSVFRQLNTSMAVSQMSAVQCRLAPLIQVIQDCSHLYHYTVKLMFKLHSCESLGCAPAALFPGWASGCVLRDHACMDGGIQHCVPVRQLGSKDPLHPTQTSQMKGSEGLVLNEFKPTCLGPPAPCMGLLGSVVPGGSHTYFGVPMPTSPSTTSPVPTLGMGTPRSWPDHSHPPPTWPLAHSLLQLEGSGCA